MSFIDFLIYDAGDWAQEGKIRQATQVADEAQLASLSLEQALARERKRNDVQAARIGALARVVDTLCVSLVEKGLVDRARLQAEFDQLRKAMEKVSLK